MDFAEVIERARTVRRKYADFETARNGKPWTDEQIALGFVVDVGDLMRLIQEYHHLRGSDSDAVVKEKLAHELADCLWCVIVLADQYDIDLQAAFMKTASELEAYLDEQSG